jgi:hypothetical protein
MKTYRISPAAGGLAARLLLCSLVCALMLMCVAQAMGATDQAGESVQTGQAGAPNSAPGVSVTLEQCVGTGEQAERSATFSGEMMATADTGRMAILIEVQERMPGEELFHTVSAPGLGVWRGSEPGVKIYKYVKQVTNLSSPAVYRALVRFHWLQDDGHVIRRAERRTSKCVQPAPPTISSSLE